LVFRFHGWLPSSLLVLLLAGLPGTAAWAEPAAVDAAPVAPTGTERPGAAAPGEPASGRQLDCVPLAEVRRSDTPADLYPAVVRCVAADRYAEATELFAVAGAFGAYDRQRVADTAAPQRLKALIKQHIGSAELDKRLRLKAEVADAQMPGSPRLAQLCADIAKLGPPDYYPAYLMRHGAGASGDDRQASGLIEPFDSRGAWREVLTSYLHCP
jgi:hypothetical protein